MPKLYTVLGRAANVNLCLGHRVDHQIAHASDEQLEHRSRLKWLNQDWQIGVGKRECWREPGSGVDDQGNALLDQAHHDWGDVAILELAVEDRAGDLTPFK